MLKVISWNVNSVRARADSVAHVLSTHAPDLLGLQETKVVDELFPYDQFEGYHCFISGQPAYNGVAWITKQPVELVSDTLPGFSEQKRFIAVKMNDWTFVNVYVPNGGHEVGGEKYQYKLKWLEQLYQTLSQYDLSKLLVCGDFNIAPTDQDVYDPEVWQDCVLVTEQERQAWEKLKSLGLSDVYRTLHDDLPGYTWWDYRGFSFRRHRGLRIDHFLVSHSCIQDVDQINIDLETRSLNRPSDHAPVQVLINGF